MIAAATGFTVVRMQRGESGPALGAARLARMAATGETAETVCRPPEIADVTEPDPELAARFAAQRQQIQRPLPGGEGGVQEAGAGRDCDAAVLTDSG